MTQIIYQEPLESNCIQESTLLKTGAGKLYYALLSAGSDAATATFYDNTSAGGEREAYIAANTATSQALAPAVKCIQFKTGLYVTITGTSPHLTYMIE